MRGWKYDLIALFIVSVMAVVWVFSVRWFFELVIASDCPDWVKYLILG